MPGVPTVLRAIAAVICLTLAGACSDDGKDPKGATVPTADDATTTSAAPTTTTSPSYDVPETIDQAYVQRVVSAYDKVLGDAIRVLKRDGVIRDEFLHHLLAIYTADEFEFQQKLWRESLAKGRVADTPDSPGDPRTTVSAVQSITPVCVVARADRDFSANLRGEQVESPQDDYIALVPKQSGRDPLNVNATPWVMTFDGYKADNSVPSDECDG